MTTAKKELLRVALALAITSAAALAGLRLEAKPNVIFILADDLGYGDTGFTWQNARPAGAPRISTPNLDRLAKEGTALPSHYCCAPVCAPSRASIMTGKIQGECSLRDNCFDRPFKETETLGTVMRKAGYATWAVGKWGIAGGGESGEKVSSHPLDRGFDYYYGFLDHLGGHTYYHYSGHINGAYMGITENRSDATDTATGVYSTDLFIAKTKDLISSHLAKEPEKPFFLYLAINTIHGSSRSDDTLAEKHFLHVPGRPYPAEGVSWPVEKEPLEKRNTWIDPKYAALPDENAARYATAITRFDDALGDLLRHLETHGIDKDTMIIFTSDNGPADENGADPRFFSSAGPFDGLKRDVYEGGMRVPALIRWPGKVPAGAVDATPSQGHAWMRFLSAAAEDRYEPMSSLVYTQYEFPWGGSTDAFKEFKARKGKVRGLQQMVRVGNFVALRTNMRDADTKVRLYNVKADPFQSRNLAEDPAFGEKLAELVRILDEHYAE